MNPEIDPPRTSLPDRFERGFKRVGLGIESKVIQTRKACENWRFQTLQTWREKRLAWQTARLEKKRNKGVTKIEVVREQAEEFLEQMPQLLEQAQERKENLPETISEIGEETVSRAAQLGRYGGKIFWGAINFIWRVGFYVGQSFRTAMGTLVKLVKNLRKEHD